MIVMKNGIKQEIPYLLLLINILVVVLVSGNLRSPITSVGPVLNEMSEKLHLSHFQGSMLTSIPLFMFAGCSVLVSRFSSRFSIQRFLLYALLILCFGIFMRVIGSVWTLYVGSVLIGLGICIGNVITPGYIKSNFPRNIGIMTGVFAVAMNLVAALASGYSVSIGKWTGYGWRGSLGIWLVIAFLAVLVLCLELIFSRPETVRVSEKKKGINLFRSSQAWNISIFMGLQSSVYYCLVSWLPAVLTDMGMTANEPGWVLFVIQVAMIPLTFIGPVIANRMKNQKGMIIFLGLLMLTGILILTFCSVKWVYVAGILLGLSNGLSFSLSILFFSLRTQSSENAVQLSGMAQSIGYLIAAFGPPVFGILHDWDSSWKVSFCFLGVLILLIFYFGVKAAGNRFVEDGRP